jgi:ketosteroid isomerase-like protein
MNIAASDGLASVRLAHRFFDAIGAGDLPELARMLTPDAVVWHNYDQVEMPFTAILPGLGKLSSVLTGFGYTRRTYLNVSGGAIAQHSLSGVLPNGAVVDVPAMVRLHVRDGRVARFEEYVDPAAVQPVLEALFAQ